MIALKKLYGDELLRLALVLSLLKSNPDESLELETQRLTAGLHISNGTDWSIDNEASTLFRPRSVHPKSLDNALIDYERQLFEELNSLGRYYNNYARVDNNDRMSNSNRGLVVHTYVLNVATTDTAAAVAPPPRPGDELVAGGDGVADDTNVGQEVRVDEDQSQSTGDSLVTLSPAALHNRTQDVFAELTTRSFDVSEFLVTPGAMHIKKEPDNDDAARLLGYGIKEERDEDLYSDNAMDDFVPYFTAKAESLGDQDSVLEQSMADLQQYGDVFDVRTDLEYLDSKQQRRDNLERFLMENTKLDSEDFELEPKFGDDLKLEVMKDEVAAGVTSSASSSGVSDMDVSAEEAAAVDSSPPDVKSEPDEGHHSGDELTQEDVDLIEVLWKQDVDMGFCLENPIQLGAPQATKVEFGDEIDKELKIAEDKLRKEKEEKIEMVKASLLEEPTATAKEDDPWAGLSYTVDTETGEYLLQGELPRELVNSEDSRFDLLEEALQLVELGDEAEKTKDEANAAGSPPQPAVEGAQGTEAGEAPATSAMLHPAMARHAIPHHHPLAHYHNQTLMRSMSVEQRWQDLASLLTIPPPPDQYPYPHHAQQHHHHNISAHGAATSYAPNYGPIAPAPDKHSDAYGPATPLDNAYKVESAHHPSHQQHEGIYYQNGAAGGGGPPPEMGNSDGFLQSILNDEDLQLMDMAMNEGMYTMRMLDGSTAATAASHPGPPHHTHTHTHTHMMVTERDSASDSAVSSMGSERVPSLSDGEWCDAGSDSAQEYHSSKFRPYDASFGRDRPVPPVVSQPPQKKHHMFGKRCFQEPQASNLEPLVPEPPRAQTVIKYEYPEQPAQAHHVYHPDGAMVASHDFGARHQALSHHPHIPTIQPALDLNTAHSSHTLLQSGVSPVGVGRYVAPYGGDRVRHNHTYSAPLVNLEPRPSVRDKRVRRLTDGSLSDGGSTTGTSASGGGHHLSRDEKRAKALGIPLEVHDIINLPMDEFNERLSKHDLSEAQLSLIRDIRRRGKNKVAAQNCRKRKLDQITSLADEVRTVRDRKVRTQRDHQSLMAERQRVKERFAALYRHVFQSLRDADGRPLSSTQYSLQQAADGNVVLVPKMPQSNDHTMNRTSDDDMERKAKNFDQ